jgi:hypothetical protein
MKNYLKNVFSYSIIGLTTPLLSMTYLLGFVLTFILSLFLITHASNVFYCLAFIIAFVCIVSDNKKTSIKDTLIHIKEEKPIYCLSVIGVFSIHMLLAIVLYSPDYAPFNDFFMVFFQLVGWFFGLGIFFMHVENKKAIFNLYWGKLSKKSLLFLGVSVLYAFLILVFGFGFLFLAYIYSCYHLVFKNK